MFKFESLESWKLAIGFTIKSLTFIDKLPAEQKGGLGKKLAEVTVRIPTVLAQGAEQKAKKDFGGFLDEALNQIHEAVSIWYVLKEKTSMNDKVFREFYNELVVLASKVRSVKNEL